MGVGSTVAHARFLRASGFRVKVSELDNTFFWVVLNGLEFRALGHGTENGSY